MPHDHTGLLYQVTLLLTAKPHISLKEAIVDSHPIKVSGDFSPSPTILRAAYKTVKKSECERYKHAAVIAKGNKIIYAACNIQRKTHPRGSGPYGTVHAEVRAIIGAKRLIPDLCNLKIFVMRINTAGLVKAAKPCRDCMSFIVEEGLVSAWTDEIVDYSHLNEKAREKIHRTYGYGLNVERF